MRYAATSEDILTSDEPRFADDPRVILLRQPCPRCHAERGHYCRTAGGGYGTLHKTRNPQGLAELEERLSS